MKCLKENQKIEVTETLYIIKKEIRNTAEMAKLLGTVLFSTFLLWLSRYYMTGAYN